MLEFSALFYALFAVFGVAVVSWLAGVVRRDVSIVDSLWSLMILASLLSYLLFAENTVSRTPILLVLLGIWAIRANNQPFFEWKSSYIVFLFQGVLAWVVCLPVIAAASSQAVPGLIDIAGIALWTLFTLMLMTILLLKVSGVALLEKDIAGRRPEYRDYIRRTNAFIPGRPRTPAEPELSTLANGGRNHG